MEVEFGTKQCVSKDEPMDLGSIIPGKPVAWDVERKGGSPGKRLHLGGIYTEEDMPVEETEMKEKITFGAFQSHQEWLRDHVRERQ